MVSGQSAFISVDSIGIIMTGGTRSGSPIQGTHIDCCVRTPAKTILLAALTVLTMVSCQTPPWPDRMANREHKVRCQSCLRSLGAAVRQYHLDNDGNYPKSLNDALSDIGFGTDPTFRPTFRCPGSKVDTNGTNSLVTTLGYIFHDWSPWFRGTDTIPDTYPATKAGRRAAILSLCKLGGG